MAAAAAMHGTEGRPADFGVPRRSLADEVVVLNDNGAWSWFEDERAVIDPVAGVLLVGSVADASGTGGASRDGNVELIAHDLVTGCTSRFVLHPGLEGDDHDSPVLYVRPDGRYVAMYSRHDTDTISRSRVSREPRDATAWAPEQVLDLGASTSYTNLYRARAGQRERLYAFVRSRGRDPHVLVSDDEGGTWARGGRLLDAPGRPYVRYAEDDVGRIHLVTTDHHPLDTMTGIYAGVIEDGRLLRTDDRVVDADLFDDVAVSPLLLTKVFGGTNGQRAWTIDLQVDGDGYPYTVFSVHSPDSAATLQLPSPPFDHRYYYARFDGTAWQVHVLAHAGSALSSGEPFYTGLAALSPHDPAQVVISTDSHPVTGTPLVSRSDGRRHHELFAGHTDDGGTTWTWSPITADSTVDNLRPVIPFGDPGDRVVLWLRGTYTNYQDYDLEVVAHIGGSDRKAASARQRPLVQR